MEDIPESQMSQYRDAFNLFDKNSDGKISTEEFATVIKSIGMNPSEKELEDMMQMAGSDGHIDFNQFVALMIGNVKGAPTKQDFFRAFEVYDHEKTGEVNSVEMKHILRTLGDNMSIEDVNALINEADPEGKGVINYREFTDKIFQVA